MRLFAFLGSLLVLLLVAALVAPPYVDWNQYKNRFEREASRALGVPVAVGGKTSARLLPLPSITFTDLTVGDPGDDGPKLRADSFTMDVELAPLLRGEVVIVDMQMDAPLVELRLGADGRLHMPRFAKYGAQISGTDVEIQNIAIKNGTIKLRDDRFGRDVSIGNINAAASARSLLGPWRGQGIVELGDERYRISLSTGQWQADSTIMVKLDLEMQSLPYLFEVDGPLAMTDFVPSLKGALKVSPVGKQSDADRIYFPRLSTPTALPVNLQADIELGSGGAVVPAFKLDIGQNDDPYVVTGSGQALFAGEVTFRVRAEGQQMNVERLVEGEGTGASLDQRLEALRLAINRVPRFDADGEINLFLPAVILGDTVIREVGMDLKPAAQGNGWQVSNLEAQLPGRTELRADGMLMVGDSLTYDGDLVVASKQPSGLAKWLGSQADPAIRELTTAGFSAYAHISDGEAKFENAEIVLGKDVLKGKIARKSSKGQRPSVNASLSGNRMDFDQLTALFGVFSGNTKATAVTAHDIDLEFDTETLLIRGIEASGVRAKIQLNEKDLLLEAVEVDDVAGASLAISGRIDGFAVKAVGEITAKISAARPAGFLRLMDRHFGPLPLVAAIVENAGSFNDTLASIVFNGKEDSYSINAVGRAGGSKIEASIIGESLNKPLRQQEIETKIVLDNDSSSLLMSQLGLPVLKLDGDGRGAFRMTAGGVANQGLRTEAALTIRDGYVSLAGTAYPDFKTGRVTLSGVQNVSAEVLDLDQFIQLTGLPLPGYGEGGRAKIKGRLKLDGSSLTLEALDGSLRGATFSGALNLDMARQPRPYLNGKLSFLELDLPTVAGLVYTGASGSTIIADLPNDDGIAKSDVAPSVLAGLDGVVQVSASGVHMGGTRPDAETASAVVSLRDGDLGFSRVKANWLQGKLGGGFLLSQSSSARLASGQLALTGADVLQLAEIGGLDLPATGRIDLEGTFDAAGSNVSQMLSSLTASGVAKLNDVTVDGVDAGGFGSILRAADAMEDSKLATSAGTLLAENLIKGEFKVSQAVFPFTVTNGTLRVSSLRVLDNALQANGEGRIDLSSGLGEAKIDFAFDPGRENVIGAGPEFSMVLARSANGFRRKIDTSLFATYLAMRVSERREREFQAQRSEILERQRLLRTVRLYALEEEAKRIAAQERERLRKFKLEQELRRKLEEARRKREELERNRLRAELQAAEKTAAREAAQEAGRREMRQQQIDLLRKKSLEAADRLRLDLELQFELENGTGQN